MGSNKKWFIALGIILIVGLAISGYFFVTRAPEQTDGAQADETQTQIDKITASSKDIATVLDENNSLSTFSDALKTTDVNAVLENAGPYTVLAPSNEAFKALPSTTLELLLKPTNKQQLTSILNYHVISGALAAKDLTNGQKLKTLNGQELIVEVSDNQIVFIDAKGGKAIVEKANISASNGVIHIVNAVLLPQ